MDSANISPHLGHIYFSQGEVPERERRQMPRAVFYNDFNKTGLGPDKDSFTRNTKQLDKTTKGIEHALKQGYDVVINLGAKHLKELRQEAPMTYQYLISKLNELAHGVQKQQEQGKPKPPVQSSRPQPSHLERWLQELQDILESIVDPSKASDSPQTKQAGSSQRIQQDRQQEQQQAKAEPNPSVAPEPKSLFGLVKGWVKQAWKALGENLFHQLKEALLTKDNASGSTG